jgi:thiol-disulfide isomerase/thioredoxin
MREAAFEYPANYAALDYVTQELSKDALVVVMHALSYCPACKTMHTRIEKLADPMDDAIFVYNAVNLQVPAEGVTKVPDVRIYRNGEVVKRFIGSKSTPELKRLMMDLAEQYN